MHEALVLEREMPHLLQVLHDVCGAFALGKKPAPRSVQRACENNFF